MKVLLPCLILLCVIVPGCHKASPAAAANAGADDEGAVAHSDPRATLFHRYLDRTEGAFLVLVPAGWQTVGGMIRVDPNAAGGPGQSLEAKIDFTLRREPEGLVMIRFLPQVNYLVPSPQTFLPQVNGMPVAPCPSPESYIRQGFPVLRPQAKGVRVLSVERRPDLVAAAMRGPKAQSLRSSGARYEVDASCLTVAYTEDGVRFREALFVAIESFETMGVAMWSNALTIVARAPEKEFDRWSPVAKVVLGSFQLNPRWVEGEMRGQRQRGRIAEDTMRAIAAIDREIAENRARTRETIQEEAYLTLTAQEEYVNPFTGRPELGSNEWKYRWENSFGELFYTDQPEWNPNHDPALNVSGFQRSQVKPRG